MPQISRTAAPCALRRRFKLAGAAACLLLLAARPGAVAATRAAVPADTSHVLVDPSDRLRASHVQSNLNNVAFADGSTNETNFFVNYRIQNGPWHDLWSAPTRSGPSMGVKYLVAGEFGPNENSTHGPCYGTRGTFFADVTGDGRDDAIVVNNDTVTVRRSR